MDTAPDGPTALERVKAQRWAILLVDLKMPGMDGLQVLEEVRKLQPGIVINRRNGGGGDYGDSEGRLPATPFRGWFETSDTCWPAGKWSYSEDWGWDMAPEVIEKLVRLRAWGGNLLANVGPRGDGSVPAQALAAWQEMAAWMAHSREAVIGAGPGPWPGQANVPVTLRPGAAYVHLLPGCTPEPRVFEVVAHLIPDSAPRRLQRSQCGCREVCPAP